MTSELPGGSRTPAPEKANRELPLRIVASLVLAPLALATAYVGGWSFALLWGLAAIVVLWEWMTLVAGADWRGTFAAGAAGLLAAFALLWHGLFGLMLIIIWGTALAAASFVAVRRAWVFAGVLYASAVVFPILILRGDDTQGFIAVAFLFAVVWVTDILAYVVGRIVGGPKLAPRFSPNKTWSGAIGGAAAATIVAALVAMVGGLGRIWPLALIGCVLSIVSQAGDLLELSVKRTFGAKDASRLIPGHGGLMDRLDGFLMAALVAAIFGVLRGGLAEPARGLLVW